MKALSIRQPWAWLIIHGGKDIENRTWPTRFRGRFLVHASKGITRREYDLVASNPAFNERQWPALPAFEDLERGGIIGSVELVDCVTNSPSPWFMGPYGFVLRNPQPLPFTPMGGRLGFFDAVQAEGSAA